MISKLKQYIILLLGIWALVLMPTQAMAYDLLTCTNDGQVEPNTSIFYDDPNALPGDPSFCSEVGPFYIFTNVICSFVSILNDVLGKMYCGMQYTLQQYVAIVITIYIMIFGIQILMGTTLLTSKEIVVRLLKIGMVWVFVSQANWGVNLLFVFFVDFANQGIWWAMGAINDGAGTFIGDEMGLPAGYNNLSGIVPAYVYIDQIIYNAFSGNLSDVNPKLLGFFAVLGFASPPIFIIAAYWLWTTFMILARTFISFLMSLSAIAFLISLSPIFFSLMLFQATYQFFENWLKYMMSFSLQVLIVFSIIALWIMAMLNFVGFFDQLSSVVFESKKLEQVHQITSDSKSVGICPYVVRVGTGNPGDLIGPNVECDDPTFNPFETGPGGALTTKGIRDNRRLISVTNIAPAENTPTGEGANSACDGVDQLQSGAVQCGLNRLFYFITYHLITLIIVAYAFDALLKRAPYIAKELAGPQYVPILGQGFGGLGYRGMRGVSRIRETRRSNIGGVGNVVGEVVENSRKMVQNPRSKPTGTT